MAPGSESEERGGREEEGEERSMEEREIHLSYYLIHKTSFSFSQQLLSLLSGLQMDNGKTRRRRDKNNSAHSAPTLAAAVSSPASATQRQRLL